MENNIKDMRSRHRNEIKALQEVCEHDIAKLIESPYEKRTICCACGKILKRQRAEIYFK